MTPSRTLCSFAAAVFVPLLGCASAPDTSSDSAVVAAGHDPSLHAAHAAADEGAGRGDSTFAALQARGAMAMGVDQYTSTHTFEARRDGGRITLRRDVEDSSGVDRIRAHLRTVAAAFAAGDFTTPAFVHAESVTGTDVMAARRALISYRVAAIDRGAELIMASSDSVAIDAIHRFLAYQREQHRAHGEANVKAPPPP